MDLQPFTIAVTDAQLADLRSRLDSTRWPTALSVARWSDGADLSFMRRLMAHWVSGFDWRAQEARLNRLPQYKARVDGAEIHFVHAPGRGPAPMPLVLTHGWPGSFVEAERILPLLTDPAAHGGDAADAFEVVVPSLPGYGFSPAPAGPGTSARRIAEQWHKLMLGLGYPRFAAQGGDIGAGVSAWLARLYPDAVVGAQLNYIPGSYRPPLGGDEPPVTADEQRYLDTIAQWTLLEGAYAHVQVTKPQTLGFALTDSPVGLAAWIVEKFASWSDCDGDIEHVFDLDTLLTNISLYWFSDTLVGSLRLYKENRLNPLAFCPGERVIPPIGVAVFPRELPMPLRSWVERVFGVRRWTTMPQGGHFAALEQPELLAEEIRQFFRPLRAA
jgi:pimeloyl-ACP methyl ester carboxylesterase